MCQSFAFARLNYALLNLVSKMLVECGSPSVKIIYKKDGSTCIHSVYTSHSAPGVKSGGVSGSDCAKAVCPDFRLHALLAEGPAQGDDWSGQQRRPASSGARPARSSGSPRPTIVIVCPLLLPYSWRSFSGLSLSCPVQILRTMDFMDSDGVIVEPEQLHVSQSEL